MTGDETDIITDHLIDTITELMTLETRIRELREDMERVANNMVLGKVIGYDKRSK